MVKKKCEKCPNKINLEKEKYVLLGTYTGKKTNKESYFHWKCFTKFWEESVRLQAQNIVGKMAKTVVPMAKKLVEGLRS